jgi:diguanylate cyclase (GGDEF)-like protein/PAS domain S-box-containing protein
MVQNQSRMITIIAEHELNDENRGKYLEAAEATLKRVMHSHQGNIGMGETGEFTLGKLEGAQIVFLLAHRHRGAKDSRIVPMDSVLAEPMRRALMGRSGTVDGMDYRGERVLAAYQPVGMLGWGIVAKIDLAEIRRPYIMAGIYAFTGAVILIIVGSALFFKVLNPLVERLESSRRYNRTLFKYSPVGLALSRISGELVDINPAYAAILGRDKNETMQLSYWEITDPKYKMEEEKQMVELLETGRYGPYEKEFIHKDGHPVPVSLTGRIVTIEGQTYIWSSVEDISSRKEKEERLREASQVFDNTGEGIIITDAGRNIIRVNRAFTRITGYTASEVKGKNPRFLQSGHHDQAFYDAMWQKIDKKGHWRGEVWNRTKSGRHFSALQSITAVPDDTGRIGSYVSVFSDISEIKAYEEQLAHLAHHDALTGLPNRMRFEANLEQALERCKRNKSRFALLFMDLNDFKGINDTLGHAVGDRLLQAVATRLKERLRGEDVVARLGGDEFTVILAEIADFKDAVFVARKLIENVEKVLEMEGETIFPRLSVGISVYPDHGQDADTLLKAADKAMYRAKKDPDHSYRLYPGLAAEDGV